MQLQNLELEKISMQQELDSLTAQAKVQSIAAEDSLIMVIICFPLRQFMGAPFTTSNADHQILLVSR